MLSLSGSAGWAWVAGPPRIEGWTGAYLTTCSPEITAYWKIIGFCVWWVVWSFPQGSPGTSGYPGSMGPPGLHVRFLLIIKDLKIEDILRTLTDMNANSSLLPFCICQGLKGERGSPGSSGQKGEMVSHHTNVAAKSTCSLCCTVQANLFFNKKKKKGFSWYSWISRTGWCTGERLAHKFVLAIVRVQPFII